MIHFACKHCGAELKAPDNSAGKNGRCPTCQEVFRVPNESEAAPSPPPPPPAHAAPPAPPPPPPAAPKPPPDVAWVVCPHCGTRLGMKRANAVPGHKATCAKCKKAFEIPKAPSAPPQSGPTPASRPRPAPDAPASRPRPAPDAAASRPRPAPDRPAAPHESHAAPTPPMQPALEEDSLDLDNDPEVEGYPWDIPADRVARAEAYEAQNACQPFTARVSAFLNGLLKNETFRGLVDAELRVYPDMVGVTERPPGCLAQLLMKLPGPVQTLLLWTLGGGLINLIFLPLTIFLAVLTSPIWLTSMLVDHLRMGYVARRIRSDPTGSYAIRKLHKYAPLGPRYWTPGEIVQIVRVDTRRRLLRRSLVVLVQDDPLPAKGGCMQMGALLAITRFFQGRRRLYVVDISDGPEAADSAAAAVARVAGAPVVSGKFFLNNLFVGGGSPDDARSA